ncbi:MAG: LPXTG cell wall anchor domain-containing protein, partial [Hominimerdicola sp.]
VPGYTSSGGQAFTVVAGGTAKITITNTQDSGVVMPETGGIGTTIYYFAGGAIFGTSCVGLVAKRRKKRRCK